MRGDGGLPTEACASYFADLDALRRRLGRGANSSRDNLPELDLRGPTPAAEAFRATLVGADLLGAQMEGADLREAQMEGGPQRRRRWKGAASAGRSWSADLRGADGGGEPRLVALDGGGGPQPAQMGGGPHRARRWRGRDF